MTDAKALAALLPAVVLAACASAGAESPEPTPAPIAAKCTAAPAKPFVGRKASSETGSAIVAATGARTLRWGPPGAVFTMDFRQDRVNVMYDDAMVITEVRCG